MADADEHRRVTLLSICDSPIHYGQEALRMLYRDDQRRVSTSWLHRRRTASHGAARHERSRVEVVLPEQRLRLKR